MKKKNKSKPSEKGVLKGKEPLPTSFRLSSKTYFLTYKGISDTGEKITKEDLANYLLNQNPNDIKIRPEKYLICEQTYEDGTPHFHVILVYEKRKQILHQDFFDYKTIHPNIQSMRNMKAALQYVYKEDSLPLTNMDIIQQKRAARAKDTSSLYQLLEEEMMKDPFNFNVFRYCLDHSITREIYKANYTKAVNLLKNVQQAYCNKLLTQKLGFKYIDRSLIQSKLSPQQLLTYDSWSGYQIIVDHLNIMVLERGFRQQKSLNLLITGPPSTGKSALVWQRNPLPGRSSIVSHCSVYPMGMKDWFPNYKSDVYHCIYWNQAKLTSYSYDVILQLLDGNPVMLPSKGGGHKKIDNPLVIMTSNMTLQQMIKQKFNYSENLRSMARQNLAVRVQNVIVPEGYNLFLLQKLFCSVETGCT